MLHACAVRFDVTFWVEELWKLNRALFWFRPHSGVGTHGRSQPPPESRLLRVWSTQDEIMVPFGSLKLD